MELPYRQQGMTGISWVLIIAIIIFAILFLIKLAPAYIQQYNVSSVLSSLKHEPDIADMTAGEVTSIIMKRLDINMVSDITHDNIYVVQEANNRIIEVDYQVQRHLIGNIDVLIKFNSHVVVPLH